MFKNYTSQFVEFVVGQAGSWALRFPVLAQVPRSFPLSKQVFWPSLVRYLVICDVDLFCA